MPFDVDTLTTDDILLARQPSAGENHDLPAERAQPSLRKGASEFTLPMLDTKLTGVVARSFADGALEASYGQWRRLHSHHHTVHLVMAAAVTTFYGYWMMAGLATGWDVVDFDSEDKLMRQMSYWFALGNGCFVLLFWGLVLAAFMRRRQTGVAWLPDTPIVLVAALCIWNRAFTPLRVATLFSGTATQWGEYIGNYFNASDTKPEPCKGFVQVRLAGGERCYPPACEIECYYTGHEALCALTIVGLYIWAGLYCRIRPVPSLLLAHVAAAWYLVSRVLYDDLDSLKNQKYLDGFCLYVLLLLIHAVAHRTDGTLRDLFLLQQALEALARELHVEMRRLDERLVELAPLQLTPNERLVLEAELGADGLGDALRRAQIDFGELKIREALGDGAFGEVHLAQWRGTPCAVKRLRRDRLTAGSLQAFKAELRLHLSLRHPNIVGLIGCAVSAERGSVCAVLELCAHGTLERLLETAEATLSWSAHKLPLALGVARALAYLHAQSPPIIHRDLKAANVLIDAGYNAKLADFGLSTEERVDETMSRAGSPLFSAPELLRHERYGATADCWSFACLLEQLHTHRRVYTHSGWPAAECPARVAEGLLHPALPDGSCFAPLVRRCAAFIAEERPSLEAVAEELAQPATYAAALLLPPGPGVPPPLAARSRRASCALQTPGSSPRHAATSPRAAISPRELALPSAHAAAPAGTADAALAAAAAEGAAKARGRRAPAVVVGGAALATSRSRATSGSLCRRDSDCNPAASRPGRREPCERGTSYYDRWSSSTSHFGGALGGGGGRRSESERLSHGAAHGAALVERVSTRLARLGGRSSAREGGAHSGRHAGRYDEETAPLDAAPRDGADDDAPAWHNGAPWGAPPPLATVLSEALSDGAPRWETGRSSRAAASGRISGRSGRSDAAPDRPIHIELSHELRTSCVSGDI